MNAILLVRDDTGTRARVASAAPRAFDPNLCACSASTRSRRRNVISGHQAPIARRDVRVSGRIGTSARPRSSMSGEGRRSPSRHTPSAGSGAIEADCEGRRDPFGAARQQVVDEHEDAKVPVPGAGHARRHQEEHFPGNARHNLACERRFDPFVLCYHALWSGGSTASRPPAGARATGPAPAPQTVPCRHGRRGRRWARPPAARRVRRRILQHLTCVSRSRPARRPGHGLRLSALRRGGCRFQCWRPPTQARRRGRRPDAGVGRPRRARGPRRGDRLAHGFAPASDAAGR